MPFSRCTTLMRPPRPATTFTEFTTMMPESAGSNVMAADFPAGFTVMASRFSLYESAETRAA